MTKILEPQEIRELLTEWGVSDQAISILEREPEVVANLHVARSLSNFPVNYIPTIIEELFDDIPFRRWEQGQTTPVYERPQPTNYVPPFVEYSFDGQTALFHIQGEIIVNRISEMLNVAEHLNLLTA